MHLQGYKATRYKAHLHSLGPRGGRRILLLLGEEECLLHLDEDRRRRSYSSRRRRSSSGRRISSSSRRGEDLLQSSRRGRSTYAKELGVTLMTLVRELGEGGSPESPESVMQKGVMPQGGGWSTGLVMNVGKLAKKNGHQDRCPGHIGWRHARIADVLLFSRRYC